MVEKRMDALRHDGYDQPEANDMATNVLTHHLPAQCIQLVRHRYIASAEVSICIDIPMENAMHGVHCEGLYSVRCKVPQSECREKKLTALADSTC